MKGYLARRRVIKMKSQSYQDTQAIIIQKYIRGYLSLQSLEQKRVEIGAAIMIQAIWKGHRVRMRVKLARAQHAQ
jgi:hypothetical protein